MDLETPQGTESVRNGEGLGSDSKRESSRPTQFKAELCDSVAGGSIRDRNTGRSRPQGTVGKVICWARKRDTCAPLGGRRTPMPRPEIGGEAGHKRGQAEEGFLVRWKRPELVPLKCGKGHREGKGVRWS